MAAVCPDCEHSDWKVKKEWLFFGKPRYTCTSCGHKAEFDVWVNNVYVGPKDYDPKAGERALIDDLMNDRTPCCGKSTDHLLAGPSGGCCANFLCDNCGAKWNICFALGEIVSVESIS